MAYCVNRDVAMSKAFGEWLLGKLGEKDMTQAELAEKLDVFPQTVHYLICGKYRPRIDTFMWICIALDLDYLAELEKINRMWKKNQRSENT